MALLVAHPDVPLGGVNVKVLNCMESVIEVRGRAQAFEAVVSDRAPPSPRPPLPSTPYSQVLGRLLLVNPGLYGALLEGQAEGASARFLDR